MKRRLFSAAAILTIVVAISDRTVAQKPADSGNAGAGSKSAKEALSQLNSLIGGWKGVGQPRRGSAVGSWSEKGEFVWDFKPPGPAIRYDVSQGKILKSVRLTFDPATDEFRGVAALADGNSREYSGKLDGDRLTLESKPDAKGEIHRITVTRLNEKRTVVLFQKGRSSARSLLRIAEVGYTREGTRLAVDGGDGPECIVTGGQGKIKVNYHGQTYYVCCSGCKQAFDENPEKILAEYKQRVANREKTDK